MKKLVFTLISFVLFAPSISAANVKFENNDYYKINEEFEVSVNINSSKNLGVWGFEIDYDDDFLKLINQDDETKYKNKVIDVAKPNTKEVSHTFKFVALKEGNTNLNVKNLNIYSYNYEKIDFDIKSQNIQIVNNNYYEEIYNNSFHKILVDGKEYSKTDKIVTLEKNVFIDLVPSTSLSKVLNSRYVDLNIGENSFNIKVESKSGETKEHKVTIVRKENVIKSLNSGPYVFQNNFLIGLNPNMRISDLLKKYNNKVISNRSSEDKIMTGEKIVLSDGVEQKEVNIVVSGDVTGDGNVGLRDLLRIQRYLLGDRDILIGPFKLAADVTGDGDISIADLLRVRKVIIDRGA